MTKRTKIIIAIILVFLFAPWLIKTGIDTFNEIRLNNSLLVYEVPADLCKPIFGVTVEEFFETKFDYNDYFTDDIRKYSKIDRKGNLILRITEEQRQGIIDFSYDGWDLMWSIGIPSGITYLIEDEEIEVAPDLSSVTINCYKDDVTSKCYTAFVGMSMIPQVQLLNGVEPESITFDLIIKDALTGKVVYSGAWPDCEITVYQDTFDLSERPQESNE